MIAYGRAYRPNDVYEYNQILAEKIGIQRSDAVRAMLADDVRPDLVERVKKQGACVILPDKLPISAHWKHI